MIQTIPDVACESGLGSDSESMAELLVLLANEIPEGWQHLSESPISPETVHNCCETKLPSGTNKTELVYILWVR